MTFPMTLHAFHAVFPDEASCWIWLKRLRWPRGFRCPRCDGRTSYPLGRRELEQCRGCRYQVSLTAGTVLHKTRVPLRTWLLAVFFVARHKQSISALQLQRDAGLGSYKTAWLLLHKLRAVLGPDPATLLSGLVEADETYLGAPHEKGRRGGRAHGLKSLVGAVVERRRRKGHLRLGVLESHTFEHDLGPFVRGAIEGRTTTVRTDGLDGYRPLAAAGIGHERIVQGTDRSRGVELFPWSHAVFSNLKSWLRGTYHGVSRKYLPRYLDEFSFRFNHRGNEATIGVEILRRVLQTAPCPYHRLEAELTG
jgi:transposase-like protein